MRKKKHLREKLDAKKISKRDDFDEIEPKKSTGSSEKGRLISLMLVSLNWLITITTLSIYPF